MKRRDFLKGMGAVGAAPFLAGREFRGYHKDQKDPCLECHDPEPGPEEPVDDNRLMSIPDDPPKGDVWIDTETGQVYQFDGKRWDVFKRGPIE